MARNEVRKECPSCGLGVPLDAKVCEFCGWDFDEEDEWISQINKLEQELITEKQKFEDTSVDKMIQSTLRNPSLDSTQEGGEAKAPPVVAIKKKRMAEVPPKKQVKIEEPPAGERKAPAEAEPVKEPPPLAPKPQPLKISITDLPAPPQNLDLELKEDKRAEGAKTIPAKAAPAPPAPEQKQPAAAAPAQPKQEKVVRRIVSKPSEARPADETTRPAKAKPAAAKPAAPAHPSGSRGEEHAKEEKKSRFGGFGKMFSVSVPVSKKDEGRRHSAPEKIHMDDSKAPPKPIVKVFVCPLCDKEVKETEKKCPNCGAEFE